MTSAVEDLADIVRARPEATRQVFRGTRRLLRHLGWATLEEMPLTSGRRADIVGLDADGGLIIVEVKSSLEDFRADAKWPFYRHHCDKLYFATTARVPADIFPAECGLIIADGFGGAILREAPEHRLAGATRRSMLLRFARLSAFRAHLAADADGLS